MKISELRDIEKELLDGLRERAGAGDNEAARVALEHLRDTSRRIEEWARSQDAKTSPYKKPKIEKAAEGEG